MEDKIISADECFKRLYDLDQFLLTICIEGGCGYDLKQISYKIARGQINLTQAIQEWKSNGHYLL